MRHILLSTVALAALAGSALAADLPSRKEAPVYVAPVPVFSWTGFYIGADIGGNFGSTSLRSDWGWNSHSLDTSGVLGGGYVGYNYQINQNFVIGIEGDFQGSSASKSWSWVGSNINGDANVYTAKIQTNWLASINGRLGVAYDRALFYAIGGAAWARAARPCRARLRRACSSAPFPATPTYPASTSAPASNTPSPRTGSAASNIVTTTSVRTTLSRTGLLVTTRSGRRPPSTRSASAWLICSAPRLRSSPSTEIRKDQGSSLPSPANWPGSFFAFKSPLRLCRFRSQASLQDVKLRCMAREALGLMCGAWA